MSNSYSLENERRLSANGKNVYISLSSPTPNTYDPQKNKYYLTARPTTNERSPLSSVNKSAPNSEEYSTKENNKKEKNMSDNKSSAVISSNVNNINPVSTNGKEKSPLSLYSEITSQPLVKNTGAIPKNKTPENKVRVPTGMDRYITITKRKSSPRTSKMEPNPKQAKTNLVSQNRFSILDTQENENTSKTPKIQKPPPLYLRESTTNDLVHKLTQLLGKENFHVVSLRKGNVSETKIQTYSEKFYRTLVESLDAEKRNYYTYQLKSAKGLVVVIKGIDSSVPVDDISEALVLLGFEVKSVHNIINKNKLPQPMFRVEIAYNAAQMKKKGDTHPIYGLRFLLNRRISVEEPIKRKGPPQCMNCQEFGHTKSFCKLPTVCVRCGDIHKSVECPYSKSETSHRKCSNCGQNHTANYRGCPVYRQLMEKTKVRRPVYQYKDSLYPSLPTSSALYGSNVYKIDTQLPYTTVLQKNSKLDTQVPYTTVSQKNSKIDTQLPYTTVSQKNIKLDTQVPYTTVSLNNKGSVIPTIISKKGSAAQKSYAHALKEGAIPHISIESNAPLFSYANGLKQGSEIPNVNTQSSIEKLIETMNSFMTNMQNMFQQLMQNQSMLMQILLSKK